MNMKAQLAEIAQLIENPQETVGSGEEVSEQGAVESDNLTIEPEIEQENEQTAELTQESDDIKTIADLATAIEVEPEYLYNINIGMGDGKEAVKLGDLKDQYQSAEREKESLQAQIATQAEQLSLAQNGAMQGQQMSQGMIAAYGQLQGLEQQYKATDWDALEEQDAGQAALLRQKYNEAAVIAQTQLQQAQQAQEAIKYQNMQKAQKKIFEIIPDWKDQNVRQSEQAQIRQALLAEGYSKDVLDQSSDPIAIKLMRELLNFRAEKAAATEAVKRVNSAPKVLKGGGKFAEKQTFNMDKARETLRNSKNRKKDELSIAKSILGF